MNDVDKPEHAEADREGRSPCVTSSSIPPREHASNASFAVASHDALFNEQTALACDVCGDTIAASAREADDDEDDAGYAVPGRGLYIWARGEQRRYEEPPLCASCASVVFMSALARWEIEEEEG